MNLNSKAIQKADRERLSFSSQIDDVIARPASDPIWSDENFWARRWPAIVEKYGCAIDRLAHLRLKEIGEGIKCPT